MQKLPLITENLSFKYLLILLGVIWSLLLSTMCRFEDWKLLLMSTAMYLPLILFLALGHKYSEMLNRYRDKQRNVGLSILLIMPMIVVAVTYAIVMKFMPKGTHESFLILVFGVGPALTISGIIALLSDST
jgi:mannose/fructose/N-acetylgalactosamine-specific phosphotransferase system component IIC